MTINKDASLAVEDHGDVGCRLGMHTLGIPTIRSYLHHSSRWRKIWSGVVAKTSVGLHGVGSSVVNALSSWLK